jgi:hypothetical protein
MKLNCVVIIFCFFILPFQTNLKAEKIGSQDEVDVGYFSMLFLKEGFGYTLIGARPMAIAYRKIEPTSFQQEHSKIISNSENFLFKECASDHLSRMIYLIHKPEFVETFNENIDVFRASLGPHITAKKLLDEIATSQKDVFSILHFDEALLGILLGYGRENSLLYRRWMEISSSTETFLRRVFSPGCMQPASILWCLGNKQPLSLNEITPAPGYHSLKEEQEWLRAHFDLSAMKQLERGNCFLITACIFRAKQSAETTQLVEKYTRCRQILSDLFYDQNVVDVVPRELTSEHPINWLEYDHTI